MRRLREIAAMATEEMGYPAINIFDHFMTDQENYSSGAFDDWCFRIRAFLPIRWSCGTCWNEPAARSTGTAAMPERSGMSGYDGEGDGVVRGKTLGKSMEAWTPYQHPQLDWSKSAA